MVAKDKLMKEPNTPPEQIYKPVFRRAIFSVGFLMRYFNFSMPEVYGANAVGNGLYSLTSKIQGLPIIFQNFPVERLSSSICHEVFETLFFFLGCNIISIRREILSAIGFFCVTNDEYLIKSDLREYYNHLLSSDIDHNDMKITVLQNIFTYLVEQENRMTRNDEDCKY